MRFSRQEYCSGFPCPPPGDLPIQGIEPISLTCIALASGFLPLAPLGKPPHPLWIVSKSHFLILSHFLSSSLSILSPSLIRWSSSGLCTVAAFPWLFTVFVSCLWNFSSILHEEAEMNFLKHRETGVLLSCSVVSDSLWPFWKVAHQASTGTPDGWLQSNLPSRFFIQMSLMGHYLPHCLECLSPFQVFAQIILSHWAFFQLFSMKLWAYTLFGPSISHTFFFPVFFFIALLTILGIFAYLCLSPYDWNISSIIFMCYFHQRFPSIILLLSHHS